MIAGLFLVFFALNVSAEGTLQIEGQCEIRVIPNKAIMEFEISAVHANKEASLKAAVAQSQEALKSLESVLTKQELRKVTMISGVGLNELGDGDVRMGFISKTGSYKAVNRFHIAISVPQKKAASELGSRVSSVFDAMSSKNAVQTSVVYDTTRRVSFERRALALAVKDANRTASSIASSLPGRPLASVVKVLSDSSLQSAQVEVGLKQPIFLSLRKSVMIVFGLNPRLDIKQLTAAVMKKIAIQAAQNN